MRGIQYLYGQYKQEKRKSSNRVVEECPVGPEGTGSERTGRIATDDVAVHDKESQTRLAGGTEPEEEVILN